MTAVNNAEALREWLRGCPAIGRERTFGADYLGESAGECSLYAAPTELGYRENILGEVAPLTKQPREFILALRAGLGANARENMDSLNFFQEVVRWIWAQNAAHSFPGWEGGTVRAIVPTLAPAQDQADVDTARYQMRLRVLINQ